jgi:hypothetical protein
MCGRERVANLQDELYWSPQRTSNTSLRLDHNINGIRHTSKPCCILLKILQSATALLMGVIPMASTDSGQNIQDGLIPFKALYEYRMVFRESCKGLSCSFNCLKLQRLAILVRFLYLGNVILQRTEKAGVQGL